MEKLKLGIIGCGGMEKSHASAFSEVTNVDVIATCDIIKDNYLYADSYLEI